MSFNNSLPWWIYELEHEHFLANCNCCFNAEWFAGFSFSMPKHVILLALQHRKETENKLQKDYESL